jgi:hypothetical protein
MRRLWSDIDRARDRLGLHAAAAPPPAYGLMGMLGCLADAVAGVASFVATLPGLAGASAIADEVVTCLERVPVVGPLVTTISGRAAR